MYGLNAHTKSRREEGGIDVIGGIETTAAGTVALRIGETIGDREGSGWMQTQRVVLDDEDLDRLIHELRDRVRLKEMVVVDMESADRQIIGKYVRRDEDVIYYRLESSGEEGSAMDDCVAVMSRFDARTLVKGGGQ